MSKRWYHGDAWPRHRLGSADADFTDQRYQPKDGDPNAQGPGIYFTSDKMQANGYAHPSGWVYTALVDGPFVDDSSIVDSSHVRAFFDVVRRAGPEHEERLYSNWSENYRQARAQIEESYESQPFVGSFIDLGNQAGFNAFDDARQWTKMMVETFRVNGFLHSLPKVDHLIVWNPKAINVIDVEPYRAQENVIMATKRPTAPRKKNERFFLMTLNRFFERHPDLERYRDGSIGNEPRFAFKATSFPRVAPRIDVDVRNNTITVIGDEYLEIVNGQSRIGREKFDAQVARAIGEWVLYQVPLQTRIDISIKHRVDPWNAVSPRMKWDDVFIDVFAKKHTGQYTKGPWRRIVEDVEKALTMR